MRRKGRELRQSLWGGRLLAARFRHVIEEERGGRAAPRRRRRMSEKGRRTGRKEEGEGDQTGSGRGGA